MNKKDKEQLLIVVFILAYILIALAFIFGTKIIPVQWISAAILLVQTFYIIPEVVRLYYNANGSKIGISRFIPFYQEICIFTPKIAVITLVTLIGGGISLLGIFVPYEVRASILGEHFALNSGYYCIRVAAVFFVLYDIFVGVGFSGVYRNIKNMLADLSKSYLKASKFEMLCYVLLFLPVIRCAGLTFFFDKLNRLVKLNNYKINSGTKSVLQEEN